MQVELHTELEHKMPERVLKYGEKREYTSWANSDDSFILKVSTKRDPHYAMPDFNKSYLIEIWYSTLCQTSCVGKCLPITVWTLRTDYYTIFDSNKITVLFEA